MALPWGHHHPSEVPYLEQFQHSPVLSLSILGIGDAVALLESSSQLWVLWVHKLHLLLEAITEELGLVKVPAFGQGEVYLFVCPPASPASEQPSKLLKAAATLLSKLSRHSLPSGQPVEASATVHAGNFSGAVVGSSSWSYALYGEPVHVAVKLGSFGTAGTVQVSEQARMLAPEAAVLPAHTKELRVTVSGKQYTVYSYAVGAMKSALKKSDDTSAGRDTPKPLVAKRSVQWPELPEQVFTSEAPPSPQHNTEVVYDKVRQQFSPPEVERNYKVHHNQELRQLDQLFVTISFLMAAISSWSLVRSTQLTAWGIGCLVVNWLGPFAALLVMFAAPLQYAKTREIVWGVVRIVNILQCSVPCLFQPAEAICKAAAVFRFGCLRMFTGSLAFKLRFQVHCLVTGVGLAVSLLASVAMSVHSSWSLQWARIAYQLVVAVVLPSLAVYFWEAESRKQFLAGRKGKPTTADAKSQ